ncbi:hypothetical protein Sjap_005894 [Stephania japonica]|uniref:Exostosin GT47 domain-containing protein n=1 Tax=Stephania japonica TaxID=461633 RepID=A0AAP0PMB4_9MAGN
MEGLVSAIFHSLMKELKRHYSLFHIIKWRKFILVATFFVATGALLQTCIVSYPMSNWFLLPPLTLTPSSYNIFEKTSYNISSNTTLHIKGNLPVATFEHFPPLASLHSLNSTTILPLTAPVVEVRAKQKSRRQRRNTTRPAPSKLTIVPPRPRVVTAWQRHVWSLPPDEALVYARKEIDNSPIVANDPDLYAPVFRNVSHFIRSYELMESILKVYIYPDGKRPIFHTPQLRGIYASEGWFMKLMEENRQFVTRDPARAHLFYLPYSARQLQHALYVPNSHNIKPLSIFLRNYVKMLAAKYPFWNRTRGTDHFLVACHDWGPYTLTQHAELTKNTIKALCNADVSEGIFVAQKDVSLPETTIRRPRKPLRNIGGKRVSQRPILAFFAGNMHGRVRPKLLHYWRDKDEDMKIYGPLPNRISRKMSYVEHMKSSRFCLCPMGYEVNSPRIIEAIYYECVPVIIADNFVLPLNEVLDWSTFSVAVAEKDIPYLKKILMAIPLRQYLSMQTNVKMIQKHFLWNPRPVKYDLFHMILHSIWFSRLNQIQIQQE